MVCFHPLHKVSQYFITEDIVILHVKRREIVTLKPEQRPTVLGMTPGLCMRADLMAWKTSTTPSVFRRSNWEWMTRNVPLRTTPSLSGRENVLLSQKSLQLPFYLHMITVYLEGKLIRVLVSLLMSEMIAVGWGNPSIDDCSKTCAGSPATVCANSRS